VTPARNPDDEPAERDVGAGSRSQRTIVDRVKPCPADEQSGEGGHEGDETEPGEGGERSGLLIGAQGCEREHGDRSGTKRAQGGIGWGQRCHDQARGSPSEGREPPLTRPVACSENVFHPVVRWYAGVNASFDPLEE
jgi:hypothetical protein